MCPRHAPDDDYDDEDYGPSKSDQKKSMERLQALGERLGGLGEDQLRKLPLDETLLAALLELRRLKAHEAIRRQKQFIGKLMRHADEETILGALHPLRNPALLRQLDLLLARLLAQGDEALGEVTGRFPAADRHTLRQLLRNARKEMQAKPDEEISESSHPARHKLWLHLRELVALSA